VRAVEDRRRQASRMRACGVELPMFGLGTVPIGNLYTEVTDAEAAAMLQTAWQEGVRYFDTAPVYGFGTAEERVGTFLSALPSKDGLVLSTKVGRLIVDQAPPDEALFNEAGPVFRTDGSRNPVFDFSEAGIVASVKASQARLGRGEFDILFLHDPDDYLPQALGESLPVLSDLKRRGVTRAIGVGTTSVLAAMAFAETLEVDCILIAGRYSLLDRSAEELLLICQERGIAVIVGGVFNGGILADPATRMFDYRLATETIVERARVFDAICRKYGVPLSAAAMQFPLRNPAVQCVLIGARSRAEIHQDISGFSQDLCADFWLELIDA
jgi:D-threo-aldose 1-dehydrogenase